MFFDECINISGENSTVMQEYILVAIIIHLTLPFSGLGVNLLPCTDVVTPADILVARNILEDATPVGYILNDITAEVTIGRNPHRWRATFHRNDNNYNHGCEYLTIVKKEFKKTCPQGSEIRIVSLQNGLNGQCIVVEFLVNCMCTNIPRRRKRWLQCQSHQYTTEHSICS